MLDPSSSSSCHGFPYFIPFIFAVARAILHTRVRGLFKPDIGGVNERWKRSFHVDTWNPIVENYANLYPPCSLVSRFIRPRIGLSALGTIKNSICHTSCNFGVFFLFLFLFTLYLFIFISTMNKSVISPFFRIECSF